MSICESIFHCGPVPTKMKQIWFRSQKPNLRLYNAFGIIPNFTRIVRCLDRDSIKKYVYNTISVACVFLHALCDISARHLYISRSILLQVHGHLCFVVVHVRFWGNVVVKALRY
jgi:hypothetical protein